MKQFLKYVLATITGMIITCILLVIFCFIVVMGIVSAASSEKSFSLKPNSVLHLDLTTPVADRTPNNPFRDFKFSNFSYNKQIGLNDILENINKAKNDPDIKGIFMDMSVIPAGIATIEEIRNALVEFRATGKFIVSYAEGYSQAAYYLASAADKVYLNPQGNFTWKGMSAQVMFFKGALEKLEINAQIFRHGKFKSAIEPFDLEKMSPANRLQTLAYVDAIWNHTLETISKSRSIPVAELNSMADELKIRKAEDALRYKLVDGLKYKDQVIEDLKARLDVKEKSTINYVEMDEYLRTPDKNSRHGKEKIALIYATGTIQGGEGEEESIGSERISRTIREARKDSTIKAIVLRVNSPGGSALASDVIWREVLLAEKTKPFVVSMGNVAASGGYYISCAADVIVAEPNTITGSIGVFGMLPNMQKFFNNKLGITVDTANSNKHGDLGSVFRPVTAEEAGFIQQSVEDVYDAFISRVAEGRKKTKPEIDSIGQGRVWSGIDAKKIGLVDELGGINDAIRIAAKKANLESYKVVEYPKQKDIWEELVKDISENSESKILEKELGVDYEYFRHFKELNEMKGIQARMPYDLKIE